MQGGVRRFLLTTLPRKASSEGLACASMHLSEPSLPHLIDRVGHLLVDRLRQPVVLMTSGGDVLHANRALAQLLRSTRLVSVQDGRVLLPKAQQEEMLRGCAQLEEDLKAGGPGAAGEGARFRSLRIGGHAGTNALHAFYTVLAPQAVPGSCGLSPVVMLQFYHPESAPGIAPGLLHAVFGLTPAEARIATLLAEGLTLKQIAETQGTRHETVRKQLRAVYAKTATNRQPELVRLLLHLPHNAMQD